MKFSFKHFRKLTGIIVVSLMLIALVVTVAAANILNKKDVTVIDGARVYQVSTNSNTVGAVINELGIKLAQEDVVEPELDSNLQEGSKISINRSFAVLVAADGKTVTIKTAPATVREILKKVAVTLNDQDKINLTPDTRLTKPAKIVINRVTYGQVVKNVAVTPKVVRKTDRALKKGVTKVLKPGVAGEEAMSYEVVYKDGKEVMRTQIASKTIKEAQDKVVACGTLRMASRGGIDFEFTRVLTVCSTAYTYTGHHTSRGTSPKVGTVAVDPAVIPLGSKLYVEGYGFARALDTGGKIKGNRIDVFLNSGSLCASWGIRETRVYILK